MHVRSLHVLEGISLHLHYLGTVYGGGVYSLPFHEDVQDWI